MVRIGKKCSSRQPCTTTLLVNVGSNLWSNWLKKVNICGGIPITRTGPFPLAKDCLQIYPRWLEPSISRTTFPSPLACVSQKSRSLFGPKRLFYVQAIYQQKFNFLSRRETLRWFSVKKLHCGLKETEFQNLLSGRPESLWAFWETHAWRFELSRFYCAVEAESDTT